MGYSDFKVNVQIKTKVVSMKVTINQNNYILLSFIYFKKLEVEKINHCLVKNCKGAALNK